MNDIGIRCTDMARQGEPDHAPAALATTDASWSGNLYGDRAMTYFPDLSDYTYLDHSHSMLNVGWLDRDHAFATGPVPDQVVATLTTLAAEQHHVTRGVHDCHFCLEESPISLPAAVPKGSVFLGMGELHVMAPDGLIFSAPSLIIHYILEHDYQPPEEFVDAVRHGQPCPLGCS